MTILGAGLLVGTALAVIIPEGISTLYADTGHHNHHHGHHHQSGMYSHALRRQTLSVVLPYQKTRLHIIITVVRLQECLLRVTTLPVTIFIPPPNHKAYLMKLATVIK